MNNSTRIVYVNVFCASQWHSMKLPVLLVFHEVQFILGSSTDHWFVPTTVHTSILDKIWSILPVTTGKLARTAHKLYMYNTYYHTGPHDSHYMCVITYDVCLLVTAVAIWNGGTVDVMSMVTVEEYRARQGSDGTLS
jgi:hypothetical protein